MLEINPKYVVVIITLPWTLVHRRIRRVKNHRCFVEWAIVLTGKKNQRLSFASALWFACCPFFNNHIKSVGNQLPDKRYHPGLADFSTNKNSILTDRCNSLVGAFPCNDRIL